MHDNQLKTVGAVAGYILAGGKNTRMEGQKKLFLRYGGETFCQRILKACDCLPAVYLSVDQKEPYKEAGLPMVEDRWKKIGPIGGIATGLSQCKEDALFVMACDMPFLESGMVKRLLERYLQEPHSILVTSQNGRIHPLFGIYPKSALPYAEKLIVEGDYRMMHLLECAGYRIMELEEESLAMENVNTVDAYRTLQSSEMPGPEMQSFKSPFVFAISGYKNTGKTTLIMHLVPELIRRGYKVAVIKHDGHDFVSDVPGTDSYRHQKAGAYGTAVFSKKRFLITKECQGSTEQELFAAFPEADIILIEGLKNSSYPKYICQYPEKPLIPVEKLADEIEKRLLSPGKADREMEQSLTTTGNRAGEIEKTLTLGEKQSGEMENNRNGGNKAANITLEEAQELVFRQGHAVEAVWRPAIECVGSVLAENLISGMMQPPFARAAMDGYALNEWDVRHAEKEHPVSLRVVYKSCAGDRPGRKIQPGESVRIMTGAMIPEGADCVIRQEDTDYGEETVQIYTAASPQQNCCQAGEDFQAGEVLAKAGETVDAYTIAAAAAAGKNKLHVRRKLRAALITTGEELCEDGNILKPGQIYNSNQAYLQVRLAQEGCDVVYCKMTGDDREAIAKAVKEAADRADFVITTGGVSVGQKDQLPYVMEKLGAEILFHGIAVKPGMPTMCSVLGDTLILSLSGNPYAAFSIFELLVRPLKAGLLGAAGYDYLRIRTIASSDFLKESKGRRLLRGYYDGNTVALSKKQQNGQLSGGIGCNCLVDIPAGSGPVHAGMQAEIILTGIS